MLAALRVNGSLRSLVLSQNALTADSFRQLSYALAKNALSEGPAMTHASKGAALSALAAVTRFRRGLMGNYGSSTPSAARCGCTPNGKP